jgi:hypothetical protein
MAILDTPVLPAQTVWHLVDEKWLVKWRQFVMGRGPRRYLPPGIGHMYTYGYDYHLIVVTVFGQGVLRTALC